jgi:hypothetical protein
VQGTPDASEAAAGALVNLSAKNEVNKLCIAAAGAIPWLIRMLDGKAMFSTFTTQEIAAAALCNLAVNEQNRVEISKEGAIPKLIQVIPTCMLCLVWNKLNASLNMQNQISELVSLGDY